ncbi:MAG TPA: rhodanese-like domain-containing protein, partial [Bacteroidia bacterium]|nr:rhodanese-like domain-containing protein [Bacteroidia bacterium]
MPVLDVRSPLEFESGHIPGAINMPLFTNEERAEVGTIYKQIGKEQAIEKGLRYVEPK